MRYNGQNGWSVKVENKTILLILQKKNFKKMYLKVLIFLFSSSKIFKAFKYNV